MKEGEKLAVDCDGIAIDCKLGFRISALRERVCHEQ